MRQKAGALRVGCYVFGAAQIGIAGLEDRLARAEPIDRVARVASFFISRIDGQIDALLDVKSVEAPA
jgi:transaldolase